MAEAVTAPRLDASRTDAIAQIRNEPVQARSTARLAALLDAAAHVVDEIGYERLTTAMVAERAGASIGTVYRYFPDRIAVLQSLALRNAERVSGNALAALEDPRHSDWESATTASFEVFVDAFRTEPGFASLRYGDVLDLRPFMAAPALSTMSERAAEIMAARFDMDASAEARTAYECASVIGDAIAAAAFRRDPSGDAAILSAGAGAIISMLREYFPTSGR